MRNPHESTASGQMSAFPSTWELATRGESGSGIRLPKASTVALSG